MSSVSTKLRVGAAVVGMAWAIPTMVGVIANDDAVPTEQPVANSSRLSPAEAVGFWTDRVDERPGDYISRTHLAANQLRLARESGDGDFYVAAAESASAALDANDAYEPAVSAYGAAQLAQHRFVDARDTALAALAIDPTSEAALALLGDASFETGDVDAARTAYRRLVDEGTNAAVLSRLARLEAFDAGADAGLELAAEALADAQAQGLGSGDLAFYRVQLASYQFDSGDLTDADNTIDEVLQDDPDQPLALFWRARLSAARGEFDDAIVAYDRGLEAQRHPEFVAELADVYLALGETDQANVLLAEAVHSAGVGALDSTGPLAGTENRHLVHILSNHGLETDRAVKLAEAELDERRDADGYDALAWALYADGQHELADEVLDRAIAAGASGPELDYHAGAIAAALGNEPRAVERLQAALRAHPHFTLLGAAHASALLTELGG